MLLPELKLRRDKIRSLMAQQEIDAALIACICRCMLPLVYSSNVLTILKGNIFILSVNRNNCLTY